MKKIVCIFISLLISTCFFIDATANNIKIMYNGKAVSTDVSPFIYAGRTFTPARAVAEAMGGVVVWDEKSKTVEIYNYDVSDLQNLAYGIYISMRCENITNKLSKSIDWINDYRKWATEGKKLSIETQLKWHELVKKDIALLKESYMPYFEKFGEKKWVDIETIKFALSYYENALSNIEKMFTLSIENPYSDIDYLFFETEDYLDKAYYVFVECTSTLLEKVYTY